MPVQPSERELSSLFSVVQVRDSGPKHLVPQPTYLSALFGTPRPGLLENSGSMTRWSVKSALPCVCGSPLASWADGVMKLPGSHCKPLGCTALGSLPSHQGCLLPSTGPQAQGRPV